jgi:arginyl-tRNA synthetase
VKLFSSVAESIARVFPEVDAGELVFAPAPKLDLGDIGLRMFEIAKKAGMAPPQAAQRVLEDASFGPDVVSVSAAGPFLNFKIDRAVLARRLVQGVLHEGARFGSTHGGAGQRVLMEHTSINPNASPHVGRGRCAMIGDSIARLLRFDDYDVDVHYYVNDMGRQIGLLALVFKDLHDTTFEQILDLYVQANARAEADPVFAEEGYSLLVKMEEGDAETEALPAGPTCGARTDQRDVRCVRSRIEVRARSAAGACAWGVARNGSVVYGRRSAPGRRSAEAWIHAR